MLINSILTLSIINGWEEEGHEGRVKGEPLLYVSLLEVHSSTRQSLGGGDVLLLQGLTP